MRTMGLLVGALLVATWPAGAANDTMSGVYVEARTAEVFTGGCTMGSESETAGRQAVAAWRIERGVYRGVALDGLSIVAAMAGERNLGMREMGGEGPGLVKIALLVDDRATGEQRDALVQFASRMTSRFPSAAIVNVASVPVRFERGPDAIRVSADTASLTIRTHIAHDAGCGAMQWFRPLTTVNDAGIGLTESQAYQGGALGTRWQQAGKRSAFFATFAF